jgi:hypothetical protein
MIDFQNPIPHYLNEKQNIIRLIVFTSLFALIFINLYSPFGADRWFDVTRAEFFTYSSLVILTGVMVVVISRIIMYHTGKKHIIKIWEYLVWIAAEILLMSLVYSLFNKYILKDNRLFTDLVKISVKNTSLVLLLPYSTMWLYLSWRDKKEQIERMAEMKLSPGSLTDMIPFYDEKSTLRFSVKLENLLYLQSAENYVTICYLNKGKISKFLLRDTLKKMEESLSGSDIIRCHRSYMVNFDKVKVIRKDKAGLMLELDTPAVTDIPVSKTYVDNVMQTFSRYVRAGDTGR